MNEYVPPLTQLADEFSKMPGIGRKSAHRLAFYILQISSEEAKSLTDAIINAKEAISFCSVCQSFTDIQPCAICAGEKRDKETICVVESPRDVIAMEKTNEYRGLYHVLHGAISPMDGITPDDLKIKELLARIGTDRVKEVIMATNPTVEGEATAMYIAKLLTPFSIRVTRIARGIPIGSDLEYTDEVTLARALEGRSELF